jgi:hypothetical protein
MLEILDHKKAENNELILKSLVTGGKTTKQIAQYICWNRRRNTKPKNSDDDEIKKIMSIISRRGKQKGRLYELETKQFIKQKNHVWYLSGKGFPIALARLDSIADLDRTYYKEAFELLQNIVRKLIALAPDRDVVVSRERFVKALSKGVVQDCRHIVPVLRDCTGELIQSEVNLDSMSEKEFLKELVDRLFSYYLELFF